MGEIYNLIVDSKNGNKESTLNFIKKFNPLVIKYSRKLGYDGAETDLIICLLEVLKHITLCNNPDLQNDGRIVGYINICIKHKYINLSKKDNLITINETELNSDILGNDPLNNIDDYLFVYELLSNLPDFQKEIIKRIYIDNISENSLAKQLHISRQAINRTKNRALNNLRKYLN